MRSSVLRAFALLFATSSSSALAQSALSFTLPYGSHAVGFKALDQYDYSRTFGDVYDETGRTRTGERARPLQTSIWYPATTTATTARMKYGEYFTLNVAPGSLPAHDAAGRRAAARRLAYAFNPKDTARIQRELDATTHAARNAAPKRGSFPVIIYGPSFNAPSFENATLMEYLASHGYIVVSSPSVGAQGGQTADAVGIESEARDMEFLIAFARSLPGADMSRVAVMGFSWGGIANVLVALRNPGVRAVVSLDGSIAYFYHKGFQAMPFVNPARFTVPALFLKQRPPVGPMLASMGADSVFDFYKDIRYSDAYVVNLLTIGHQNFGEWFIRLQQNDNPVFVTDPAVQSAGFERIALYARHFLDAYLKQSADGKAFLAKSPLENGYPANEIIIQRKTGFRPLPSLGAFQNALDARHRRLADAPAMLADVRSSDAEYALDEMEVNAWGYRLMAAKQFADAIGVFRINVTMYPKSSNVYDSLGEAFLNNGDRALAIENYQRSLDLDPSNTNAVEALKKLRGGGE